MGKIAQDFSAAALVAGIYANLCAYYRFLGRAPQVELHDSPRLSWMFTGMPDPFLNTVFHTRLSSPTVAEAITTTVSRFMGQQAPLMWLVEPGAQPPELGSRLTAAGLQYTEGSSGMAADVLTLSEEVTTPSDLRIEVVNTAARLQQWLDPYTVGFGLTACHEHYGAIEAALGLHPRLPRQHYVGLLKGEPVASSTLYLGVGVAGIYNVATVPEARRQGIGAAMTLAPLREARAMGYRISILHASPLGLHIYRRLGFTEYCKLQAYIWVDKTRQV